MSEAITDYVELNVLGEAPPVVPAEYKNSKYIFLANTAPALQMQLLEQMENPVFVAADTMNCWIEGRLNDLKALLKKIQALTINGDEARALAGESNLITAMEKILGMGPGIVVVKKGESGSIMCSNKGEKFIMPAYPAAEVKDPTGAGDSFAGALMGYLAKVGRTDFAALRTAIAYGTVAASFTISDFSVNGLAAISINDIEKRLENLKKLTQF
jgi:sugar/nucleoside kinase (ribokinase family)